MDAPDLQFHVLPTACTTTVCANRYGARLTIAPTLVRVESRAISSCARGPDVAPGDHQGYFDDSADLDAMLAASAHV